ncbi:hypothetical protein AVEN_272276-1 [Araneus ventricosus]|uniref:Uncharacterized protein n=1 Tax=Araneus ventricosus TaxID=182803 RepID=A0A4Y2I5Y2_ARAVE|nr:hypothetical protein AVEN_272276-1 [Araneus ventricosus]
MEKKGRERKKKNGYVHKQICATNDPVRVTILSVNSGKEFMARKKKGAHGPSRRGTGGKKRDPLRGEKETRYVDDEIASNNRRESSLWGHSGRAFKGLAVDGPITAFNGKNVFTYGKVR